MKRVYYEGTDTLKEGYALCYNHDYGTAASEDEGRFFRVEKPSVSNALYFAGVVAPSGESKVGPCYVDIILPGSYCNIWSYRSNTINAGRTTFCAAQYYFYAAGFPGQGTAVAKQTIDRSSTAGLCYAYLEEGPQSGGVEKVTPSNGAMTIMGSGVTYFPVTTIATGNATYTLADGTYFKQRKAFFCEGTMTTNDIVVTVTTPSVPTAYAAGPLALTAYGTFTMDAVDEYLAAEWDGKGWVCQGKVAS